MAKRVCSRPGCGTLVDADARGGRCPACERGQDAARGTRQQRGYDAAFDAAGRDYQRRMNDGERFDCWRCGKPVGTRRGIDWVLGHCDLNRGILHGPEHPGENYATSGRTGCPHASHTPS